MTISITQQDYQAVDAAICALREIIRGNAASDGKEAIDALKGLMAIVPKFEGAK